ncbi:MAG: AMP-binding protein [Pseudomonadota bacterium]
MKTRGNDQETLGAVFAHLARTYPEKPALRTPGGQSVTFDGLNTRINALNASLVERGLCPGDRVAVLAKNSIAHVEIFGLTKSGIVVVPLNWRLYEDALVELLRTSRPKAIFADDTFLDTARSLVKTHGAGIEVISLVRSHPHAIPYASLIQSADVREPDHIAHPDDPLCILFTSGTTGQPKGVVHSHRSILNNLRVSSEFVLGLEPGDSVMAAMPFFHVGGLFLHFFAAFYRGCTTTILPEYSASQVLDVVARHKINNVHLVPTMIGSVLDALETDPADLSSLNSILYAASPIPTTLLLRALDALPNCKFVQSYGATESGMVTALSPADHIAASHGNDHEILLSCGKAVAERAVRVVANDKACIRGEIGEIEIRSPGMMDGYWEDPAASQAAIIEGWLKTGDLGFLDENGFVYIVDRKNDMIVTGGENVYPTEVEEHLSRLQDIAAASVFGVPDPRWVEKVVAAVVLKPGAEVTDRHLIAELKRELAAYKCPKEIHFLNELPKNAAGKVLRKELQARFSG